jgi:hypothetical protein
MKKELTTHQFSVLLEVPKTEVDRSGQLIAQVMDSFYSLSKTDKRSA